MLLLHHFSRRPPATIVAARLSSTGPTGLVDLSTGQRPADQIPFDAIRADLKPFSVRVLAPQDVAEIRRLPYGASNSDAEVEA